MKRVLILVLLVVTFTSCKNKKEKSVEFIPQTIAEKIAYAHGFEKWKHIAQVNFTFNIDRDTIHYERKWKWDVISNDVIMINNMDTVSYNRAKIDSISIQADRRFVNDKYWLFVPFQLLWDEGTTLSNPVIEEAPISKQQLQRTTLTYSDQGGYTPGDAYDIYFDEDYIIKEWVFREGNSEEPSMITTFENYQIVSGLNIAMEHKKSGGNWNLSFTDVQITKSVID